MKKTKNFRISDYTDDQLAALANYMGMNDTEVFGLAIDRLYQSEIIGRNTNHIQLRWQTWRNWFYNEMSHEARRTAQLERHLSTLDSQLTGYDHHAGNLAQDQQDIQNAQDLYYGQITPLDTRIKQARRENNDADLAAALSEAEQMIEAMRGYFLDSAKPD